MIDEFLRGVFGVILSGAEVAWVVFNLRCTYGVRTVNRSRPPAGPATGVKRVALRRGDVLTEGLRIPRAFGGKQS